MAADIVVQGVGGRRGRRGREEGEGAIRILRASYMDSKLKKYEKDIKSFGWVTFDIKRLSQASMFLMTQGR